jgi:hypothetical protein
MKNNPTPLLPCPFCGGEAQLCTRSGFNWIVCEDCGLLTRRNLESDAAPTLSEKWNRRWLKAGNRAALKEALEELEYIDQCQVKNEAGEYVEVNQGVIEKLQEAIHFSYCGIDPFDADLVLKALEGMLEWAEKSIKPLDDQLLPRGFENWSILARRVRELRGNDPLSHLRESAPVNWSAEVAAIWARLQADRVSDARAMLLMLTTPEERKRAEAEAEAEGEQ